jgi:ferric-dicitrate binding protein FerR (iron transport regulator)
MVAGIIYRVFFYQTQIMEETGFGEIASITLPDKSVVKLNGNSRIRYSPGWSSTEARQVWVEGEAFFSVVHTANDQKFIVHTSDREAVEVLGTTFTVTKRKSGTRVVLNTGKVRFQVSRQGQRRTIILKPGDLVQVKGNSTQVEKRSVDPAAYSSWVHQKMVFDNTPLVEVLTMLEETYGLQVVVGDRDIYSKKVSGSTPVTNINLLLAGLERSLGLKITRNGNKVLIEKKLIDQ